MHKEKNKIKIIIADDHPLMRFALRRILENEHDIEVIGEAGDGLQAVDMTLELKPDVIILDISMPKLSGLNAIRQILAKNPHTRILVLSVHTDVEHVQAITRAGANGYLSKSDISEGIARSIRAVAGGETVMSHEIYQTFLTHDICHSSEPLSYNKVKTLTSQELTIVGMLAAGLSNKEIATKINLSVATVKNHLADILIKLDARSRTEAVLNALRMNLISLDNN